VFQELDFVAAVDVGQRVKGGPSVAPVMTKEIVTMREDVIFYATRLRGVHQVTINETPCTKEEWDSMMDILLDGLERENSCTNPFYQVRNVINLGLDIRRELMDSTDLWYGIEGE